MTDVFERRQMTIRLEMMICLPKRRGCDVGGVAGGGLAGPYLARAPRGFHRRRTQGELSAVSLRAHPDKPGGPCSRFSASRSRETLSDEDSRRRTSARVGRAGRRLGRGEDRVGRGGERNIPGTRGVHAVRGSARAQEEVRGEERRTGVGRGVEVPRGRVVGWIPGKISGSRRFGEIFFERSSIESERFRFRG